LFIPYTWYIGITGQQPTQLNNTPVKYKEKKAPPF